MAELGLVAGIHERAGNGRSLHSNKFPREKNWHINLSCKIYVDSIKLICCTNLWGVNLNLKGSNLLFRGLVFFPGENTVNQDMAELIWIYILITHFMAVFTKPRLPFQVCKIDSFAKLYRFEPFLDDGFGFVPFSCFHGWKIVC
jgi:hypothetical protein